MLATLTNTYFHLILHRPRFVLLLITALVIFFAWHSTNFRLDASSDSLLLEDDEALKFYQTILKQYGTDEFLVVTYTPKADLFSAPVKRDLRSLTLKLKALPQVKSVISILDVPLIDSPPVTLSDLRQGILTLESPEIDLQLAIQELLNSPIYRDMLISRDGTVTAIQVNLKPDYKHRELRERRDFLREKRLHDDLSENEEQQLKTVSAQFKDRSVSLLKQQRETIIQIRKIMDQHRDQANLFLGGLPMITSDSIDFIRHDLMTFGIGVLVFLIILLAIIFQQPRWVILPMLTCAVAGLMMIGFLGWVSWPVTVVSSNFISLMLILTLALMVHLIVRYRELQAQYIGTGQAVSHHQLIRQMISSKAQPGFYTAITTIIAFTSLIISGIRPVIDFGWMMTIGITMSFILAFTLFPAMLALLPASQAPSKGELSNRITGFFAYIIQRFSSSILLIFLLLAIISGIGISKLSVENRFIDYFKETTEIHQGMLLIDKKLGGTIPLDIIIDAPAAFFQPEEHTDKNAETEAHFLPNVLGDALDEALDDVFEFVFDLDEGVGITGTSYWFNTGKLPKVNAIHDYLDGLNETGKVLSIATSLQLLRSLDEDVVMSDFFLSILYQRLPQDIKQTLFHPFMTEDGNQLRFSIRIHETYPTLKRDALLQQIHQHLTVEMGLDEEQVHLTGMFVLYNNLLQSLFKSQILTISVVFFAILFMFILSFRNTKMAAIAIIPNIMAASMVLGLMGWLGIPLDIMTITIAAISIGIAVDNTIHYVHRFTQEFSKDGDYWSAIQRSHNSIGRAMYYTTITITLGFSILALSNFIPSIYFGLLTGFSMVIALLANLTLLAVLIAWIKPLGDNT